MSIVKHHEVVLDHRITRSGTELGGLRRGNASRQPENAGAAEHRHLPVLVADGVVAHHAERAPVVGAAGEDEVERHEEAELVGGGVAGDPLGPAHDLRFGPGPDCEWVVYDGDEPEEGRRRGGGVGLSHRNGGGVLAADDVVEVEVELGHFLLCVWEFGEPFRDRFGPFLR